MKKKSNNKYNILFLVIIIFVAVIVYVSYKANYLKKVTINSSNAPTIVLHKYTSNNKKISFTFPEGYDIDDAYNSISLKKNNQYITLDGIGTNYTNLTGYLDSLERRNRIQIEDRQEVLINGRKVVKARIQHPISKSSDTFSYFFYPEEWTVYSISTDSIDLKDDLDKIAQSFTYTP